MSFCMHPESEYYHYFPTGEIKPGCIIEMKAGNSIPCKADNFIIISPACDIVQRKTDTITVLPVIPFKKFFSRPMLYSQEIVKKIKQKIPDRYQDLLPITMWETLKLLEELKQSNELDDVDYIDSLITWCLKLSIENPVEIDTSLLVKCLGKAKYKEIVEKLIVDNYLSDTYFLPKTKDEEKYHIKYKDGAFVLLRYPIVIPSELILLANNSDIDWKEITNNNYLCANNYFNDMPIIIGNIKETYYNEIYGKYLSYQVRMGSPDFNEDYKKVLVLDICGGD